ncbi:hypothetical protein [Caulobacter sp.]|uniref:hypothetical protein n=1 Tax=Caulobacter sp. TaxID=78 RepID=UPI001B214076|nr:hypothetical protein [Caulobacter sp.]MBO9543864.1 hypothetical protein [Caulobacter sp.]
MIRQANSSMLLSSLLGLGRQGGAGDETANLVRAAAMRADQAVKAAPTKTAELPARTATARPAVTVSLSRMAQAAQAAQIAKAAQAAPPQQAALPEARSEPARTSNGSHFTDEEYRKMGALMDFALVQHQDYMRFHQERILPSEDVSAMTPVQARQRLDDLSVLPRWIEVGGQLGGDTWARPNPFSIATNNGEITESMDTYMGWLKDRAAQSEAPAKPTSSLNIRV